MPPSPIAGSEASAPLDEQPADARRGAGKQGGFPALFLRDPLPLPGRPGARGRTGQPPAGFMRRSFELLSTPGAQAGPGEIGRPYARAGGRERIALPELSALAFLKKVSSWCIVLFQPDLPRSQNLCASIGGNPVERKPRCLTSPPPPPPSP